MPSRETPDLPSHLLLPVLTAIRESSERIVSRIEHTEKVCENMKMEMSDMIKKAEENAVEKALKTIQSLNSVSNQYDRRSHTVKRKFHDIPEGWEGIESICQEEKVASAISSWICNRISSDLSLYWSSGSIEGHNSSLSVLLFGIQRKEGLGPYRTTLGKDLGIQAREIVSSLMWNARCANMRKISYERPVPKWIYSLVPICREAVSIRSSNPMRNGLAALHESNSDSNSTERSEANGFQDYADISDDQLAWRKEAAYFREAVFKGCQTMEQRKPREKIRKIHRVSMLDAVPEEYGDRVLSDAKDVIAHGAHLVRKSYSNVLSQNRCNARERFFDALGFVLYKIKKLGKDTAQTEGFSIKLPAMTDDEVKILEDQVTFNQVVRAAAVTEGQTESDTDHVNQLQLKQIIQHFPNLVVPISYKITVEKADEQGVSEGNGEGIDTSVPDHFVHEESVNLISLGIVILTEFTRKTDAIAFMSSSKKSLRAVVCVAIALRALISRSLNESICSFEQYVLGNVYLLIDEVPHELKDSSTVMSFITDESNKTRARNRLTITRKQYINMKTRESEQTTRSGTLQDDLEDSLEDIFSIPTSS